MEAIAQKLAKEGNSPSAIGQLLRDRYGIPLVPQVIGQRLERILSPELRPKIPEDLDTLVKKAVSTRRHLEKNRKDYPNKRSLALIESKIHRLAAYYRTMDRLPKEWEYKPVAASLK